MAIGSISRGRGEPQQLWRSTVSDDLREMELSWEDVAAAAAEDRQR